MCFSLSSFILGSIRINRKLYYKILAVGIGFFILFAALGAYQYGSALSQNGGNRSAVLGVFTKLLSPIQENVQHAIPFPLGPSATPTATVTPIPSPTPIPYGITLIYTPEDITEGDNAAFTWDITGPANTIHSTTIYYGMKSTSAALTEKAAPQDTSYTAALSDFIEGEYAIPLRFVANAKNMNAGTYFFRAYARIEGKHFWTPEQTFTVKPIPKHEIKLISYPTGVKSGENVAFTWEVLGPAASTGFTAIVASKQAKPGPLDSSVALTQTPYSAIVKDFSNGTSQVPLRFIGNAAVSEPGVYFFRALAFINDKNIWSDEYSFTVQ